MRTWKKPLGDQRRRRKLTDDEARDIFTSDEPMKMLAARYGVSYSAVWKVKERKTYTHVNGEKK